jgi:hypothetical protein
VARAVGGIRARRPAASIVVLIDETDPAALRAARDAGATSFIGAHEAGNAEAVSWRLLQVRSAAPSPGPRAVGSATAGERPSPAEDVAQHAACAVRRDDAALAHRARPAPGTGDRLAGMDGDRVEAVDTTGTYAQRMP